MSEKPEALRLAQEFELHVAFGSGMTIRRTEIEAVAAELRRLHAENERLNAVALQAQSAAIDLTKKNERLREAIEAYIRAKDSDGGGKGGFFPKPPTVAHQRRVHLAWQELNAALRREDV